MTLISSLPLVLSCRRSCNCSISLTCSLFHATPAAASLLHLVPDGLSPAQYAKLKKDEAAKKAANKKKAMKGSVETLTQWQARNAEKVSSWAKLNTTPLP